MTTERKTKKIENYMVKDIKGKLLNGKINLQPEYQRGHIWINEKSEQYIWAFINNMTSERFTLNEFTDTKKYNCIDGQQRLTAIKLFISNEIYFFDKKNNIYYFYNSIGNNDKKKYKILSQADKKIFDESELSFTVFKNLTYEEEVEIFIGLQNGNAVNNCEQLHANFNHIEKIKIYDNFCIKNENIIKKLQIDTIRKKNCMFLSKMLYYIEHNILTENITILGKFNNNYFMIENMEIINNTTNKIETYFKIIKKNRLLKIINENIIIVCFVFIINNTDKFVEYNKNNEINKKSKVKILSVFDKTLQLYEKTHGKKETTKKINSKTVENIVKQMTKFLNEENNKNDAIIDDTK
jgi:hypothetical protein